MSPDAPNIEPATLSQRSQPAWPSFAVLPLLLLGAFAHLAYLLYHCPLDLSGDEAHYWEWSRRLDLSYYSKGPLIAYVIAGGRWLLADVSQRLVGSEALAVRVPAIVLSLITGVGLYVLTNQTLRATRAALAVVALTFTVPIFAVGAMLTTIDAPLACLCVWTLILVERGLCRAESWPWLFAGVLIALGILAKYTMVLIFPAVGVALLLEPRFRPILRKPAPYVGALLGLLGFVPIIIWNAQHNWVSFRHVAGQAGVSNAPALNFFGPVEMLAGQLAVVGPIWFIALLVAVVALWRRPAPTPPESHASASVRFLLAATITPWLVIGGFSFITKVQPNWPVLALLPGMPLLVAWLRRQWWGARRARRLARIVIITGAVTGGTAVVLMHHTEWFAPALRWVARREPPWNLTPVAKYDPTARLRGWSQLGAAVGEVLQAEQQRGRAPFVVTDDYQVASEVAFYTPGHPQVYCLQSVLGDRQSQYDLWRPNPIFDEAQFKGRPCIYIGALKPLLTGEGTNQPAVLPGLTQVRTVEHRVGSNLIQLWAIYTCDDYAGLPPDSPRTFDDF